MANNFLTKILHSDAVVLVKHEMLNSLKPLKNKYLVNICLY